MRLNLVFVGKTAFQDIHSAAERYLERIRHYIPVTVHLVKAERITAATGDDAVRERESHRMLKLVGTQDYLVVWDRKGVHMDSEEFSGLIAGLRDRGTPNVWMVVGGPLGVSRTLTDRADSLLSFSRMTFPHDLARLVVLEQLYRAFTIIRGEPYHK